MNNNSNTSHDKTKTNTTRKESLFSEKKEISRLSKELERYKILCNKYRSSHEKMLNVAQDYSHLERQKNEYKEKIKYANYDLAKAILVPIEWLEITLNNAPQNSENSWLKGLNLVLEKFKNSLKEFGIKEINVKVGDKYDSNLVEVIDSIESKTVKKNHIVKINRKGYYIYDRVLQHARVVISK